MKLDLPKFNTKKELFAHLVANKVLLITEKQCQFKQGDSIDYVVRYYEKGETGKAIENPGSFEGDKIAVEAVINTTNIMDSHDDVHIKGIWTKSLKESKGIMLLQEHKMNFDSLISDDVKASVKEFDWQELGLNVEGKTQALMFKTVIEKSVNEYMFDLYLKGRVKNHSVGMRYVKIALAIDDEDYKEEKAVFDKYIDRVANKDEVMNQGYFYAVTEAKIIEGSAVLKGSNFMTPTLSVNEKTSRQDDTQNIDEPQILSTQEVKDTIKNFKFT